MLDERRIEKDRTEVSLLTVSGETISGWLFVQPYLPARNGKEHPVDVLNSATEFVPIETESGIVLVAKSAIAEVEYDALASDQVAGAMPIGVAVTLSLQVRGGKIVEGNIWVEGPVNTPRLLDFMNRAAHSAERFVTLRADSRVRLINRSHIQTIRTTE